LTTRRSLQTHLNDTLKGLISNVLAAGIIFALGVASAAVYGLLHHPELLTWSGIVIDMAVAMVGGLAGGALLARYFNWDLQLYYQWFVPSVVGKISSGSHANRVAGSAIRYVLKHRTHGQRVLRRLQDINDSYTDVFQIARRDYSKWDIASSARRHYGRPDDRHRYPTLVWPQHLARVRYWPNVSFHLNVLYGQESVRIIRDDGIWSLGVDLSGDTLPLGIYGNAGKAALLQLYHKRVSNQLLTAESSKLHRLLMAGERVAGYKWSTLELGPLRWPSAGVLPVASGRIGGASKREKWVILHFRDILPVGWNLANGGPETALESSNLQDLIEREFVEEVMVLAGPPKPGGDDIDRLRFRSSRGPLHCNPRYIEECRRSRLDDDLSIVDATKRGWLDVSEVSSPFTVRVRRRRGGRANAGPGHEEYANVWFSLNALERGIEVIRIYQFNVESGMHFLDGELFPWKPGPPPLVRRPIVLLNVSWLRDVFGTGGRSLGDIVENECKLLPPIPRDAYVPFVHDVAMKRRRLEKLRLVLRDSASLRESERRMRGDELSHLEGWIRKYERRFVTMSERQDIVDRDLRRLCPVTWKTLELACQYECL
jgi:hypothetical protein